MTRHSILLSQYNTLRESLTRMSLTDPKRDVRIKQVMKLHKWLKELEQTSIWGVGGTPIAEVDQIPHYPF